MANEHRITVSVVYALPEQQWLFETEVERGTNCPRTGKIVRRARTRLDSMNRP